MELVFHSFLKHTHILYFVNFKYIKFFKAIVEYWYVKIKKNLAMYGDNPLK